MSLLRQSTRNLRNLRMWWNYLKVLQFHYWAARCVDLEPERSSNRSLGCTFGLLDFEVGLCLQLYRFWLWHLGSIEKARHEMKLCTSRFLSAGYFFPLFISELAEGAPIPPARCSETHARLMISFQGIFSGGVSNHSALKQ